ncbi:hypothetical protein DdX_06714 [Ditylenchus destructor]|uniref:Uncharacterized protein n=1 Tax=Ditylenchus destructor TaxID=166010 RepID=A0AAD4R5Z7_9BILA|nr:hypothetical protein DdX_06714 [Ditylenchus destructor]
MAAGSYITYVNFSEAIVTIFCQLVTITLMANLISCSQFSSPFFIIKSGGLSKSMLVYLYTHLILTSLSIFYHIYLVVKWHAPDPELPPMYDPQILFWLGMWPSNYLAVAPLVVLLLAVDRILSLKCHARYTKFAQNLFISTGVILIISATCASVCSYLLELPLETEKVLRCEHFSCVVVRLKNRPQLLTKVVLATANTICSFFFFYVVRQSTRGNSSRVIKDRVIKNTIMLEIFFDVIPGYFAYFFNLVSFKISQ